MSTLDAAIGLTGGPCLNPSKAIYVDLTDRLFKAFGTPLGKSCVLFFLPHRSRSSGTVAAERGNVIAKTSSGHDRGLQYF